jgi:DNA-binding MarR family transcriptional regulator
MSTSVAGAIGWIKHRHLALLSALVEHRQLTASSAAALLGLSPSSISRLARPLIENGYVSRTADTTDYRVVTFAPTPSGRALRKICQQKDTTTP